MYSQVLAGHHGESEPSGEDDDADSRQRLSALKVLTAKHGEPAFHTHTDKTNRERHERCEPEDRRKRIGKAHALLLHERLGEGPAKTRERRGGEDHEEYTGGDEGDDADEVEGEALEAEDERED